MITLSRRREDPSARHAARLTDAVKMFCSSNMLVQNPRVTIQAGIKCRHVAVEIRPNEVETQQGADERGER